MAPSYPTANAPRAHPRSIVNYNTLTVTAVYPATGQTGVGLGFNVAAQHGAQFSEHGSLGAFFPKV